MTNTTYISTEQEKMFQEYKDVLTIKELCEALQIGYNTAYKLLQNGTIKNLKIGNAYRIPKIYLIDYVLREYD